MSNFILKTLETRELKLNTIRLRGFYGGKLRKGSGGGGSGDGFPQLPGDVTRWHFGGLTNEMMAAMDDPRIEDADHKGRFLSFKNFAWSGMSGVGGYETNAEIYEFSPTSTNKIVADRVKHISYTFEVKGMVSGNDLSLRDGINTIYYSWKKDGIYTVDVDVLDPAGTLRLYNGYSHQKGTFTVRIFPSYPGAIVFDGVDDCGVCDNFPILTKEKGYTVVALRRYLAESIGYLVYNGTNAKQSAFAFERSDSLDTWSWGKNSSIRNSLPKLMSYQTSNSYNNNPISTGEVVESNNIINVAYGGGYCNVAIWELVFLDHDATEEELTKIKDYFVKTYPWLFPDQAWTVTGKTNEDEDRATIANITGNGNDLLLSNFGFAQGSGYGLYYQYFGKEFMATNGEIEGGGWNIIDNYNISHDKRIPINSIGKCFWGKKALVNGIKLRFKLTGMTEGDVLAFGYAATYDLTYTSDGIYAIDLPPVDKSYGFSLQSSLTENLPTTPVTIELLPFEYEGYLVTDGVDDKIDSSAFKMGKDFTVVGDWKFIIDENEAAGLVKPPSFYLFNKNNGLKLFINATEKGSSLNTKSLKAICSDGRVYFDDWSEMLLSEEQPITSSSKDLSIGYNSTIYTQMAFKNLGIYNNQLLSKDDCIKAYNYLQTLKAK